MLDGDGNCHVYVDAAADLDMAREIVVNAKTQRPGVCNAAESLLGPRARWPTSSCRPRPGARRRRARGDERVRAVVPGVAPATEDDFAREFLGLTMSVAVVDDLSRPSTTSIDSEPGTRRPS